MLDVRVVLTPLDQQKSDWVVLHVGGPCGSSSTK